MNKNILITGGAGFIGINIAKKLRDLGNKITIYDNLSRESIRYDVDGLKINFVKGDIRDRTKLNNTLKNIDVVFHLAFINGTRFFYDNPKNVIDVGLEGILNLMKCMKKNNNKELYLASSSEVYQTPLRIPTNENEILKIPDVYNPRYSYGSTKAISEVISVHYGKEFLEKLIIFRPHNVYGPNMGKEHVIPSILNKVLLAKKNNLNFIEIEGSGKETRSFNYIDDFCYGIELLFNCENTFETFNIGSNDEIKIIDLVKKILFQLKIDLDIKTSKIKAGSTKRRCPDIKKISSLGYFAKTNLEDGLNKTINWYLKDFEQI